MKIYLIRHTAVDVPEGICYGQTDVPLKTTFEVESKFVKVKIQDVVADAVFTSPLTRCAKLAEACGYVDAQQDSRLKELHFGDWEGKQWNNLDMTVWKDDWVNPSTPNGESFMQMYERVTSFLEELRTKSYGSVIIFTHGGVISCARVYFDQIHMKQAFDIKTKYGEIVKFEFA